MLVINEGVNLFLFLLVSDMGLEKAFGNGYFLTKEVLGKSRLGLGYVYISVSDRLYKRLRL